MEVMKRVAPDAAAIVSLHFGRISSGSAVSDQAIDVVHERWAVLR